MNTRWAQAGLGAAVLAGIAVVGYQGLAGLGLLSERAVLPDAGGSAQAAAGEQSFEIITVLPKDAIPAIDNPQFLPVARGREQMSATEQVIGVSIGGEHRAYPTATLSSHEIVNDVVGGRPIAVTW